MDDSGVLREVLLLPRKMGPGDLAPMRRLAEETGNPQNRFKTVIVGGTNGKGSITAMVSSILSATGFRVGSYYSPHVDCVGERIQAGGGRISEEDIARIFESQIKPLVEAGLDVSFFEAMTAIAFHYFAEQGVDYAVLEVGLGGRFDATNVADALVSVVATVDLEHTNLLGGTVAEIAGEKAATLRKGGALVTLEEKPEALAVFMKACADNRAELLRVSKDVRLEKVSCTDKENAWGIHSRHSQYSARLRLLGEHQARNAACAVLAVEALKEPQVSKDAVERGLAAAFVPARLEVMRRSPTVIMDCAHNPSAMKALARSLKLFKYERLVLVIGMMADKDIAGTVKEIAPLAGKIFANRPSAERAAGPEAVASEARKYCRDVEVIASVAESYRKALTMARENDLVLLCGSIYMVSEARGSETHGLCQ